MDFGQAFSFPFKDPEWPRKLGIPALLLIIPILGTLVVLGWALEIVRRVVHGEVTPLPEIDFGRHFVDGLKAIVVGFVYSLPGIILSAPSSIAQSMLNNTSDLNNPNSAILLLTVCCSGLAALYSIFIAFVLPAGLANMIIKDNLGAAFRFSEVWGLVRAAPGAYLIVLLGSFVAGIIGSLGLVLCIIGVFATLAYEMAITGNLYGQAYREATRGRALIY